MQTYTPLEHRPGDTPQLFQTGTATPAVAPDGKVLRVTGPGRIAGRAVTMKVGPGTPPPGPPKARWPMRR